MDGILFVFFFQTFFFLLHWKTLSMSVAFFFLSLSLFAVVPLCCCFLWRLNLKRFISFHIVCNLILSLNGKPKFSYVAPSMDTQNDINNFFLHFSIFTLQSTPCGLWPNLRNEWVALYVRCAFFFNSKRKSHDRSVLLDENVNDFDCTSREKIIDKWNKQVNFYLF